MYVTLYSRMVQYINIPTNILIQVLPQEVWTKDYIQDTKINSPINFKPGLLLQENQTFLTTGITVLLTITVVCTCQGYLSSDKKPPMQYVMKSSML